jgi:hypothetical protein
MRGPEQLAFEENCHKAKSRAETILPSLTQVEQAVDDGLVKASQQGGMAHRQAPEAGVVPPFSDHSGSP